MEKEESEIKEKEEIENVVLGGARRRKEMQTELLLVLMNHNSHCKCILAKKHYANLLSCAF